MKIVNLKISKKCFEDMSEEESFHSFLFLSNHLISISLIDGQKGILPNGVSLQNPQSR